ncbi:hypothetical protein TGAM01_v203512 [Trichoderma gamsii]|uniref:Uncharacterized protein n=1 Tax=Trichoderma gamsii TaxID=398673 RepID=A0A2P4ZTX8_9HYPO|nr:hypothetical protein TGAM01_v203512 [Trichoderma gamsii]PON27745.1 hypothetical protein TGAM01_v203512 [Trichoderma gamsii]
MLNRLPLAIMAVLPLANARFNKPRAATTDDIRCCPCLPSALSPSGTTVTVTVTSPKETVTVDHTVVQPATTIFVTQTFIPESSPVVTQEVTVHPEPSVQTNTVIGGGTGSPDILTSLKSATTKTVTKTILPGGAQTGGSQPESPTTVTVTIGPDQSSPDAKTTAVESKPASSPSIASNSAVTVTISQAKQFPSAESPSSANGATITLIAASESAAGSPTTSPSVKTVTFVQEPDTVETITFADPANPSTTTVTLASNSSGPSVISFPTSPAGPSTTTITLTNNLSNSSVETVTIVENPVSPSSTIITLAGSLSGPPIVQMASSSAAAATPASSPSNSPSFQTAPLMENSPKPSSTPETPAKSSPTPVSSISIINNLAAPNATVTFIPIPLINSSPLQPAITAPPQVGTISPNINQFTTLTQTVTSGNTVNIEITIINIFTGETICRKKGSGKPCDSKPKIHASGEIGCLTTGVCTETATAFNTVIVTVESGIWTNGTTATGAALPLGTGTAVAVVGTGSPMIRRGRMPMIRKRF